MSRGKYLLDILCWRFSYVRTVDIQLKQILGFIPNLSALGFEWFEPTNPQENWDKEKHFMDSSSFFQIIGSNLAIAHGCI